MTSFIQRRVKMTAAPRIRRCVNLDSWRCVSRSSRSIARFRFAASRRSSALGRRPRRCFFFMSVSSGSLFGERAFELERPFPCCCKRSVSLLEGDAKSSPELAGICPELLRRDTQPNIVWPPFLWSSPGSGFTQANHLIDIEEICLLFRCFLKVQLYEIYILKIILKLLASKLKINIKFTLGTNESLWKTNFYYEINTWSRI